MKENKHKPGTDPKPEKGNDSKGHQGGLRGKPGTSHSLSIKEH